MTCTHQKILTYMIPVYTQLAAHESMHSMSTTSTIRASFSMLEWDIVRVLPTRAIHAPVALLLGSMPAGASIVVDDDRDKPRWDFACVRQELGVAHLTHDDLG